MSEMKKYWFITEYKAKDKFEKIVFCKREDLPQWSSLAGPYDTEEEAKKSNEVADFVCSKCGGLVQLSWLNPVPQELKEHKLCFKCNCFKEVKEIAETDKNRVIIDGTSYHARPDAPDDSFQGFGGRLFRIIRDDDPNNIIVTKNLWCQGDIPEIWKKEIPNNAKFL